MRKLYLVLFLIFAIEFTVNAQEVSKVIRIVDEDTFEIESGEKVRLLGIDTPEKWQSSKLDKDAIKSKKDKAIIQINNESLTNNFSANIYLDKQVFLEGENIYLSVKIKNESGNNDSLPILHEQALSENVKIKSTNYISFRYHGMFVDYAGYIPYAYFKPYEEKTFVFEIQWCYGIIGIKNSNSLSDYFPEDDYSLYVEYKNLIDTSMPVIKSNVVTFKVLKPIGIEKEAFDELKKIYEIPLGTEKPKSKNRIDAYRNFMKTYPNSLYMDRVIDYSSAAREISKYKFDDTYISDGISFVKIFPNSHLVYATLDIIIGLMKSNKSNNEIKELLLELNNNFPNTKIQKSVERLIDKLEDIEPIKY